MGLLSDALFLQRRARGRLAALGVPQIWGLSPHVPPAQLRPQVSYKPSLQLLVCYRHCWALQLQDNPKDDLVQPHLNCIQKSFLKLITKKKEARYS